MKILLAGGAGFIGSHLAERFLSRGDVVTVVDNFITGDERNLAPLFRFGDRFSFLKQDITLPFDTKEDYDLICNLACPASPLDYQRIPLETLWVSAAGTRHLLEFARRSGATFLHASTSEIYGDPLEHPQRESYFGNVNCLGPRSCYDEGKRFAESLIQNYRLQYGLQTKIVRIFNTYGPRMRKHDGRVIPNFIDQALTGTPLTLHGDGSQTRSFCYVEDMVDGLLALVDTPDFFGPVNLGNPEEISMKSLAETILKLTRSSSPIHFKPLPEDDPKVRRPDIALAQERLGFHPKTPLQQGLLATLQWFQSLDESATKPV